jgi:hypothetical protein
MTHYFIISLFQLSQDKPADFWDETEPFGNPSQPSPDLRLPAYVVPSFYRLKLRTDLENSNFTGEVYITIRTNKPVKEIVLHAKDLNVSNDTKLTEQIYERVETLHTKTKREINTENETVPQENEIGNGTKPSLNKNETSDAVITTDASVTQENSTNSTTVSLGNETITESTVDTTVQTTAEPSQPADTQVTHSSVRNIKIISQAEATGDRLILRLASSLSPDVDYTLQLSFSGRISNSLTGFYKSTYVNAKQETK